MRIYKTTDRIGIRIDDIQIKVSPLNFEQKTEIETHMRGFAAGDLKGAVRGMVLAIKYALKEISGVEDSEGQPYQLSFEGSFLTDECVSDLLNLDVGGKLSIVCSSFVPGIPKDFSLEGVEFVEKTDSKKKSKR